MKRPLTPRCLVYLVEYKIEGEWQTDGEWFVAQTHALAQARDNEKAFGWPWRLLICNSHRRENGIETCEECPLCAAETERAAIVAYGKKYADQSHPVEADTGMFSPECRGVILGLLDDIERGEHRKGGG